MGLGGMEPDRVDLVGKPWCVYSLPVYWLYVLIIPNRFWSGYYICTYSSFVVGFWISFLALLNCWYHIENYRYQKGTKTLQQFSLSFTKSFHSLQIFMTQWICGLSVKKSVQIEETARVIRKAKNSSTSYANQSTYWTCPRIRRDRSIICQTVER